MRFVYHTLMAFIIYIIPILSESWVNKILLLNSQYEV